MTDKDTPIDEEINQMAFQDQNERAAANPVYGTLLAEQIRQRKRIEELERKCAEDATGKD